MCVEQFNDLWQREQLSYAMMIPAKPFTCFFLYGTGAMPLTAHFNSGLLYAKHSAPSQPHIYVCNASTHPHPTHTHVHLHLSTHALTMHAHCSHPPTHPSPMHCFQTNMALAISCIVSTEMYTSAALCVHLQLCEKLMRK